MKESLFEPPTRASPLERDLTIIRQDIVAVLQETASVRETMTNISSFKRAASKRFVVLAGLVCFVLMALLILYQSELRSWFKMM